MVFIDLILGFTILTLFGMIQFDIFDDCSKGKISKTEAGIFTFIFSVFAVVALLIIFV